MSTGSYTFYSPSTKTSWSSNKNSELLQQIVIKTFYGEEIATGDAHLAYMYGRKKRNDIIKFDQA